MTAPPWWDHIMELLTRRMDNGWYYRWDLGYNNIIDWTGHPGEQAHD